MLLAQELMPPETIPVGIEKEKQRWRTEFDVISTLKSMGHDVCPVGLRSDLAVIANAREEHKPQIAFNLLEDFEGQALYDQHVVSYLELLKQPYTGCNPRGLTLAKDKALISQASVVNDDEKLVERVEFIHRQTSSHAIAEQYIEGREVYVSVIGNRKLQTYTPWELIFNNLPDGALNIATGRLKWNPDYQKKVGLVTKPADLPPEVQRKVERLSKRIYRLLSLSGYARMDYRLTNGGEFYLLEANPNPQIAMDEDFSDSAKHCGIGYGQLLQKILTLGLSYNAAEYLIL